MPDLNETAGSDASPSGPTAGETVVQPDYKALYEESQAKIKKLEGEEWPKRAAGWQREYNTLKEKYDSDTALLKTLEGNFGALKTAAADLETKHKTTSDELERVRIDNAVKAASLERLGIITREFPHLLSFLGGRKEDGSEEPDLLPDATGDELRISLKAFSEKLSTLGAKEQKRPVDGASPKPPAPEKPQPASLWAQALDALGKGDVAAYDAFYKQHIEASK